MTRRQKLDARSARWLAWAFLAIGMCTLAVFGPVLLHRASKLEAAPALPSSAALPAGARVVASGALEGPTVSGDGFVVYVRREWDVELVRRSGDSRYEGHWDVQFRRAAPIMQLMSPAGTASFTVTPDFRIDGATFNVVLREGGGRVNGVPDGRLEDAGMLPGAQVVAFGTVSQNGQLLADRLYGGTLEELVAYERRSAYVVMWFGAIMIAAWPVLLGVARVLPR